MKFVNEANKEVFNRIFADVPYVNDSVSFSGDSVLYRVTGIHRSEEEVTVHVIPIFDLAERQPHED